MNDFIVTDPAPAWVAIEFLRRFCSPEKIKPVEGLDDYVSQKYDGVLWAIPHLVTRNGAVVTIDDVSVLEIDALAERVLTAMHIDHLLARVTTGETVDDDEKKKR